MCFSPEASFTAAIVLGGLSYACLRAAKQKSLVLLALFPCFFAIQQFSEGIVWLDLKNILSSSLFTHAAQWIFLLMALGLWPIWMPFSLFFNEQDSLKRNILLLFFIFGVMIAYRNLQLFPLQEVQPAIVGNQIQYLGSNPLYGKIIYGLIVVLPCFLSSLRFMWVVGVLLAASFVASEFFYSFAFISAWCFFATIISIALYFVIKNN